MNMSVDSAIVLDDRSAVNNAVLTDGRACVDDDSGHNDGASCEPYRRSNDRRCMNQGYWQKPIAESEAEASGASVVVAHCSDKRFTPKAMQFLG
jgi:hypothetical protein